jgi:glycosyltransferase involved in cell wall biosynthesis
MTQSPIRVCMHVLGAARTDGRVMRAATALAEAGFAVSIVDIESVECQFIEHGEPIYRARHVSRKVEHVRNVCIKHVDVPASFMATRFRRWGLLKALWLFLRTTQLLIQTPADIYHAHDVTALPACYIAARLRHKPLIFDAHELPLKELEGAHRRWLRTILTPLLATMIRRSAGIITASPLYAREIRKRYAVGEVSLIRNLPPYRNVRKNERLRQQLGLSPTTRIALYQGYLQPDRGLDVLVRAAAFLEQDIVIVMMGKAVEETRAQLRALIVSEGVAERVKIIPAVPYEELLDWTASADIGLNVLPPDYSQSIRLCLPNKLFEYLMAGLPVLTSELDAVAEVVRACDVGHVVSSLAPRDVAVAINTMLADDAVLARMRSNALDVAQREFCWEKEAGRLVRFYEDKCGRVTK